jgi:hypothetical protein
MTHRTALAILVALAALAVDGRRVSASPNDFCFHRSECGARELCVTSSDTASTGTCQHLRVLP